ncbi:MAG: sigma-70 family RNA polymerase sigma factor [Pyrinomonadaceae bacterium]
MPKSLPGYTESPSINVFRASDGLASAAKHFLEEEGLEDGVGPYAAPGHGSPARVAESRERSEIVRRAVSALPEELREVLVLKEYEEMTFQEVAETLDLPLSTVKSRLYTALRQLRLRLVKYGEGIHVDDQRTSR